MVPIQKRYQTLQGPCSQEDVFEPTISHDASVIHVNMQSENEPPSFYQGKEETIIHENQYQHTFQQDYDGSETEAHFGNNHHIGSPVTS